MRTDRISFRAVVVLLCSTVSPGFPQVPAPSTDPQRALERAEHLADLYNWYYPVLSESARLIDA